jgi:hypothetical protein
MFIVLFSNEQKERDVLNLKRNVLSWLGKVGARLITKDSSCFGAHEKFAQKFAEKSVCRPSGHLNTKYRKSSWLQGKEFVKKSPKM